MDRRSPPVLALDIVVLLPPDARAVLTRLNARLSPPPDGFHFDDSHLPHVTLVQQFVHAADVPEVQDTVGDVLRGVAPLAMRGTALRHGATATVLVVGQTPALHDLHRRLIDRLAPLAAAAGDAAAFLSNGEPARDADIAWVTHFAANAARDRFDPHVTLGVGALDGSLDAFTCLATDLAVCHLGRFCTCRRVLGTWTLTGGGT